ncbi:ABC transporter permease [Paenibacillus sp. UNC451MF]|uniref:ABC transporter permease n=1 Tax=Paenibacillus sp. UNC451MF TaxID=1449063 RepID=UPI00048B7940|nr:ABC transporter permease [Paenibacillus sp. UNC451MF]
MNFAAYIQLTLAQLRLFARNRQMLFFTLLFPLLLMIMLGSFVGKGGSVSLDTVIVDQDSTPQSQSLIATLEEQSVSPLKAVASSDETEALDLLKKGDKQFVIVIPKGYGEQIAAFSTSPAIAGSNAGKLDVYYDETDAARANVGLAVIGQLVDGVSKKITQYKPAVTIEGKGVRSLNLKYIDFLVPGIVAMMIMSNNLNGVAGQISSWRERGVLRRMQSTPLRAPTFIAGQITARLLLNCIQALLVMLIASLFFNTQVNGSWWLLILFVVLGTLTFMAIGFIIAGVAKTPESAGPIAGVISFPLMFLGGVFFPINSMPEAFQAVVKLLPISHLSTALRQVMNTGASFGELWPQVALLGGWTIVAFIVASFTFRWD